MEACDLQQGDWFISDSRVWYVILNDGKQIVANSPSFCTEHPIYFKYNRLSEFTYLGRGKIRWWWRLVPWRNIVVPFTRPKTFCWW